MAIEHPYVHAWFGAGGEANLQVLRVDEATQRVVRVYKANKPTVCFARRYVLMVLKGGTDCVPVPKPSARGMKRESAASPFPSVL